MVDASRAHSYEQLVERYTNNPEASQILDAVKEWERVQRVVSSVNAAASPVIYASGVSSGWGR